MSAGALDLHLTDLAGEPVRNISVELLRFSGEPGTGGETQHVTLAGPDPDLLITGITCRGASARCIACSRRPNTTGDTGSFS